MRFALPLVALACLGCQSLGGPDYDKLPAVEVSGGEHFRTVQLKTRPGVRQGFVLALAEAPRAVALFFRGNAGLDGTLNIEYVLPRLGVAVAVIDPPSDLPAGFTYGDRSVGAHVDDVDAVIQYLRKELGVPVWVVGLSMGSVSAANVAVNSAAGVDGVVFMAPVTSSYLGERNRFAEPPVTSFALERVTAPVLAVAHREDGCPPTPPFGIERIMRQASSARVREAKLFEGGYSANSNPCIGRTYHTFAGIEPEVCDYVGRFIVAHSRIESGG